MRTSLEGPGPHLADVPDDQVSHRNLFYFASSDDRKLVFTLDATLQTTELLLFRVVIESRDENHNDHRDEDGHAFDPPSLILAFVHVADACGGRGDKTALEVPGKRRNIFYGN